MGVTWVGLLSRMKNTHQSVGQHRMRRAERTLLFQQGRRRTHHKSPHSSAICTRRDAATRAAGLSAALRRRKIYLQSLKHQEFVQAEDCPTSMRVPAMYVLDVDRLLGRLEEEILMFSVQLVRDLP